ncbi:MAG: S-layer family protein [Moorea sp. SIO2I5]|nr:S-layer family protein [Moorena sp. SIO2I5]
MIVNARTISFDGSQNNFSSGIFSNVGKGGIGNAGDINITTDSLSMTNAAQIAAATFGKGNGGNVMVNARTISLDGRQNNFSSGIFSNVGKGGVGNAGDINIFTDSLSMTNAAQIAAATFGKGNGGNVMVNARTISFDGSQNNFSSGIFSNVEKEGVGKAGDINITTDSLSMTNAAQIAAATFGKGNGGNVIVNARTISFDGRQNNFSSGIFSNVEKGGIGNAGDINIFTDSLSMTNAAQIAAATFGKGNGGNVMVNARTISFDGRQNNFGSGIVSNVEKEGVGKAGDINITTDSLSITNAAQIAAATFGQGNGGNVIVNARTISFDGRQNNFGSGIITNAESTSGGNPGDISIATRLLSVNNAAEISAANRTSSESTERVGNININSAKVSLDNQGSLSAESASGNGGNINLQIRDLLLLRGGSEISTNAGTDQKGGDGGNIDINSKFLIAIPQENSDITANAFRGRGGNVQIISQGIFGIEARPQQTDKSDITASSDLGIAGNINVVTPDNSAIQNSLTELQQNPIDTKALIANSCIARSSKVEGTFVIIGSGGLPNRPGDAFVSPYPTGTVQGVIPDTSSWKKGDPIIEATGVYRLANGQLVMSRECL